VCGGRRGGGGGGGGGVVLQAIWANALPIFVIFKASILATELKGGRGFE